jgi:hypothetical protein
MRSLQPLIAGACALLFIGLLSAAALIMEEDKWREENKLLAVTSEVTPGTFLAVRKRQERSPEDGGLQRVKRRIIFLDRERVLVLR